MTSKYSNAIRLSAIAIALITLFPPWNSFERGHLVESLGYAFLFTPPEPDSGVAQINITTLAVECLVSLVLVWGFALGAPLRNSKEQNNGVPNSKQRIFEQGFLKSLIEDSRYFSILLFGLVGIAGILVAQKFFGPQESAIPVPTPVVEMPTPTSSLPTNNSPAGTEAIQVDKAAAEASKKMLAEMHEKHLKEVAKEQQLQKQADLQRAKLFQPKIWRVQKTQISGVNAHLQTVLDAHSGVFYKFWLSGNPEVMEMAKSYYSGYTVQLLNRQGFKIGEFNAFQSDFVSYSKASQVTLVAKGNLPLLENEYSKITQWVVSAAR